jgi:signal peptidase II
MSLTWLASTGIVLAADQATKGIVVRRFAEGEISKLVLSMGLRRITNKSSGVGQGGSRWAWLGLWAVAALGIVLVLQHGAIFTSGIARAGLGAALGGATGNLLDRWRHHGVVDFIDLGFWPVFNLADIAIVVGTGLALFSIH